MPKFVEVPTEDWLTTIADAKRYRWMRGRISGREYREIGLEYGEIIDVDLLIDEKMAALDVSAERKP